MAECSFLPLDLNLLKIFLVLFEALNTCKAAAWLFTTYRVWVVYLLSRELAPITRCLFKV